VTIVSANITVMTNAVRKAAKAIVRDFGEIEHLQVSRKGTSDFVTNLDRKSEKILFEELSRARPDYGFLMEESGVVKGTNAEYEWVIDPIDGTSNFIHAIPYVCISVALEKIHSNGGREPIAAVTYSPILDELYIAEKGQGAYVNDKRRLKVSGRKEMDEIMLATCAPRKSRQDYDYTIRTFEKITQHPFIVRTAGATALDLAYLSAGRYDGAWYNSCKRWDIAAGILLVREAGGMVTELPATETHPSLLIVSNPAIHDRLVTLISKDEPAVNSLAS
jgi:myo-inositol-1(or 4)-monophosphatase